MSGRDLPPSDESARPIPLNDDDEVSLDELVRVLAGGISIKSRSQVNPTNGRVIEEPSTGGVYIGNGTSWIDAADALDLLAHGMSTNVVNTERVNNRVCVTQYSGNDLGEMINNARSDLDADSTHDTIDYYEDLYLYAEPGEYTLSTPANLTTMLGSVFDFRGCHITLQTDGEVAFDLAESWDYQFHASRIYGDPNNPPSSGLLVTNTDTQSAGANEDTQTGGPERKWHNVQAMWGYYDYAPIYLQGRERTKITGNYANDASQGYALAITPSNKIDIGGVYQSETSPHRGSLPASISAKNTWISGASFFSIRRTGDGVVWIEGLANGTVFRDVEAVGSGERAIFVLDASEGSVSDLTFENVDIRLDRILDGNAASSRGWYVQDGGAGNTVDNISISKLSANLVEHGEASPQPIIEAESGMTLKRWDESSSNVISSYGVGGVVADSLSFCSFDRLKPTGTDVVQELSLRDVGFYESGPAGPLTLANGAELIGKARRRSKISNDGGAHAISTSGGGANVVIRNVEVEATGSSYDAINLSGGGQKWGMHNVRVSGSGRDGIVLNVKEGVATGLQVDGFGSGVAGDDLVLDEVRNVISGGYFNGDVRLTGNATDCMVGSTFIRGGLTLESGSSGNDLSNTIVGGAITDNGSNNATP